MRSIEALDVEPLSGRSGHRQQGLLERARFRECLSAARARPSMLLELESFLERELAFDHALRCAAACAGSSSWHAPLEERREQAREHLARFHDLRGHRPRPQAGDTRTSP
jgi:hypothetical protein